jgi:hypothetical protein
MVWAKPALEVSVLPGMIEMVVGIIPAGVMPDPLAVGMDVRGVRVSSPVAIVAVFCGGGFITSNRSGAVSWRSVDAAMFDFAASLLRESRNR